MIFTNSININGYLTIRENGNIIVSCKNEVTNIGVGHLLNGNSVEKLTYVATGESNQSASKNDLFLVSEISRYRIDEVIIDSGEAIILCTVEDNLIYTAQEWGLFYDGNIDAGHKNSGILFSRAVSEKTRFPRQKLSIEWRITIS